MSGGTPLLSVTDLVKHYPKRGGSFVHRQVGTVHAVCGVSFDIDHGETLGLVGESGCGKTTTGRAVLQLVTPTSGSVRFEGRELIGLDSQALREVRKDIQVVFQDPFASLDPRVPVGESIAEPLHIHKMWGGAAGRKRGDEALALVGLEPRQLRRAMCVQRLVTDVGSVTHFDEGDQFFAPAFTWAAHHQSVRDRRVGAQYLFDLFDEHLFAAGVDHQRITAE